MSNSMGRPVADLDDFLELAPEPPLRAAAAEPVPDVTERRSKGVWWILGLAGLLVAGGLSYWFLRPTDSVPIGAGTTGEVIGVPSGVTGFAEMYVAAYLTDAGNSLEEFLPSPPSTEAMTAAAHYVTRTAAMAVDPAGNGYWSVLVAADVLALDDGGYRPVGLQFYQVGVVDDGGRLVATSLPARVAGPAARAGPPRSLHTADAEVTDVQAALVGDFLEALLTDGRDISRYVTADSGLSAISPPPYTAVVITGIGLYPDGSILATVDAQEMGGSASTLQYALRLAGQGSGLAVSELLPGPPAIDAEAAS
ncbi:MAG: conjugal transfer protein [bacterium]|nr:conjugal transfer protein [bacterium]